MTLSKKQKLQVEKQLKGHRHKKYRTDIVLTNEHVLKDFIVHPNVLRPEQMVALFLARFLFFNNGDYLNKKCLDVGCGSGLQGLIMALFGAEKVIFSDISNYAVENTQANIKKFKMSSKTQVLQSDLFENINGKFDVIVFNHPFFPADPIGEIEVSIAMLDSGNLLKNFLNEVKRYLKKDGKIIMPFYDVAGKTNDPKLQGKKHNYDVRTKFSMDVVAGLQKGKVLIYELT